MVIETTDINKFQNRGEKSIRVLAFIEANKGQGGELISHILTIVEPSRKEEGNIAFVPHVSIDKPDQIVVDEIWTDKEALDNHFNQQHIKDILPRIQPLLAKPLDVRIYSEVKAH